MGERTITVPDDVYDLLQAERESNEDLGDVIDRLLGERRLEEFWGAWDDETTSAARGAITASRQQSVRRTRE